MDIKNYMQLLFLIMVILVFAVMGCATIHTISKGEQIYKASCANCHRLIQAETHTEKEWDKFIKIYGEKANLNDEERKQISDFLKKNAREEKK